MRISDVKLNVTFNYCVNIVPSLKYIIITFYLISTRLSPLLKAVSYDRPLSRLHINNKMLSNGTVVQ